LQLKLLLLHQPVIVARRLRLVRAAADVEAVVVAAR
jgi:hypothetical protein